MERVLDQPNISLLRSIKNKTKYFIIIIMVSIPKYLYFSPKEHAHWFT